MHRLNRINDKRFQGSLGAVVPDLVNAQILTNDIFSARLPERRNESRDSQPVRDDEGAIIVLIITRRVTLAERRVENI